MRRPLIVLVALAVLAVGALAAYVVHRLNQSADQRGSTTVEYVTTETMEVPPPLGVPWGTYGFSEGADGDSRPRDGERRRLARRSLPGNDQRAIRVRALLAFALW